MNLTTDRTHGVSVLRVNEARLMYPLLSEFAMTITSLIGSGERRVLLDLSTVTISLAAEGSGAGAGPDVDGDLEITGIALAEDGELVPLR